MNITFRAISHIRNIVSSGGDMMKKLYLITLTFKTFIPIRTSWDTQLTFFQTYQGMYTTALFQEH